MGNIEWDSEYDFLTLIKAFLNLFRVLLSKQKTRSLKAKTCTIIRHDCVLDFTASWVVLNESNLTTKVLNISYFLSKIAATSIQHNEIDWVYSIAFCRINLLVLIKLRPCERVTTLNIIFRLDNLSNIRGTVLNMTEVSQRTSNSTINLNLISKTRRIHDFEVSHGNGDCQWYHQQCKHLYL